MFELIKSWSATVGSLFIGAVGFIEKCSEFLNLVFVALGIVGLILSIRLTLAKIKKLK